MSTTTCKVLLGLILLASGSTTRGTAQVLLEFPMPIERSALENWSDTVLLSIDPAAPLGLSGRKEQEIRTRSPLSISFGGLMPRTTAASGGAPRWSLKVNRLRLEENSDHLRCALHIEVLERRPEGLVRLFEQGTIRDTHATGHMAASHAHNIREALTEILAAFDRAHLENLLTATPVDKIALTAPFIPGVNEAPILGAGTYRKGVYRSFTDMRLDRPDTTVRFEVRETSRSPGGQQVLRMKDIDREVRDSIWGFSTGQVMYRKVGRDFLRLDRHGPTFTATIPATAENIAIGLSLGVSFGLVGVGVGMLLTPPPQPAVVCDLNMLCGDLVPRYGRGEDDLEPPSYNRDEAAIHTTHVFHVSRFAKSDSSVVIQLNDSTTIPLRKGQWTSMMPPPQQLPIDVWVTGPKGQRQHVQVDTHADQTMVYLVDVKKDGLMGVTKLKDPMRSSVINDLRAEDQRN